VFVTNHIAVRADYQTLFALSIPRIAHYLALRTDPDSSRNLRTGNA
jgi:hypothetical protein